MDAEREQELRQQIARKIIEEMEARERAMFKCAERAWADRGGYELHGWQAHSTTAVVAYGYPPRAKHEYQHVFLFEKRNIDGTARLHLRTVGKAPWHRSIGWWGLSLTAKSTFVCCYPPGTWVAESDDAPC